MLQRHFLTVAMPRMLIVHPAVHLTPLHGHTGQPARMVMVRHKRDRQQQSGGEQGAYDGAFPFHAAKIGRSPCKRVAIWRSVRRPAIPPAAKNKMPSKGT